MATTKTKTTKPSRTRKVKAKKVVETEPLPTTPVEEQPVEVVEPVKRKVTRRKVDVESTTSTIDALLARIGVLEVPKTQVRELRSILSETKRMRKDIPKLTKIKPERKPRDNSRSGLSKPTLLSDPLADFMEVERGSRLPRTAVTKKLNVYIKEHELQNPESKRFICPDSKLRKLFRLKSKKDTFTYCQMQTLLKENECFIKE